MRAELRRLRAEVGELLAKHERAKDLKDFARYVGDPVGFIREVLHSDPWSAQARMAETVRDAPRSVTLSANGIGKDWTAARIALWWVYALAGRVIITGPTERQVKHIVMAQVRRAFTASSELPGDLYALELRVDDEADCGILAFTSDSVDRLSGYHHPRLLILVTEGQGVEEGAYEGAQACLTGAGNRIWVYGNPTRPTGPFHRVAHSDGWATLRIRADEHPNVITGREEIPGAVSRQWVESMAAEYGRSSPIYRSRVLAEFPEETLEGLVRRDWLRAAFDRHDRGDLGSQQRPVMALDVARYGVDRSALAVVQGPVVREILTWHGASITDTVDRVIRHGKRIEAQDRYQRRPTVWVDEPGLGGGAIDVLRSKDYPVRTFNGARRPADARRFLNERAAVFWSFRRLLEGGKVALPRDPLLEEEALAVEWQINAAGRIQMLDKDLIRREIGRSPDRLDAVVIGLAASTGALRRGVKVEAFAL